MLSDLHCRDIKRKVGKEEGRKEGRREGKKGLFCLSRAP
jgi:hypothetical protein